MGVFLGWAGLEYHTIAASESVMKSLEAVGEGLERMFGESITNFIMWNSFKGIYTLQALAGLSFVHDIKVMRDKKNNVSEQVDKCNKMLELLEKI